MDDSNSGFSFTASLAPQASLNSALRDFPKPELTVHEPTREFGGEYFGQLDVVALLAGDSPVFALRVTEVSDGTLLGVSISHGVAGKAIAFANLLASEACKAVSGPDDLCCIHEV